MCWDNALEEAKAIEAYEKAIQEGNEKQAKEFIAKWPNHCPKCGGWGDTKSYQSHPYGMGTASEAMFDVCECLEEDPEKCPRCGEKGLDQDANGPCNKCEWNYDDGRMDF